MSLVDPSALSCPDRRAPQPFRLFIGDVWVFDAAAVDQAGHPVDLGRCVVGAELYPFAAPVPLPVDPAQCEIVGDPRDGAFTVTVLPELTSACTAEAGLRDDAAFRAFGIDRRRPDGAPRTRLVAFYIDAAGRPHTVGEIPILPQRR